jgi:hypothetical protein
MAYRPRIDCSDVPIGSDDHWLTNRGVNERVVEVLLVHEATTVGIAEVPLSLNASEVDRRLERWAPRLRHLGRVQDVGDDELYHWTVAELIAHEALHAWWAKVAVWPLGWWPWERGGAAPAVPPEVATPEPFSISD